MTGVIPFSVTVGDRTAWGIAEHGAGAVWLGRGLRPEEHVQVSCLGRSQEAPRLLDHDEQ
jgi:hypothetical protein